MSAIISPQLELLRAKLALAIGPMEANVAYDEVKAARPNALDEPWSNNMSGPHKHVVFNNKTFELSEVANEELASSIVRGIPPIDAGENIKLYLNDIWQLEVFRIMGFDLDTIRYPLPGRVPVGSLYYTLLNAVNELILTDGIGENGDQEDDGNLGAEDAVAVDGKGDEAKQQQEGAQEEAGVGNGQEELDGDGSLQGELDAEYVKVVMED